MSRRTEKVEEVVRDVISEVLLRELKDPRLGFVTVTGVKVSPDLRNAQVYYSVLGDEAQRQETATALSRAKGFVRTQLGRRAAFRFVPELDFRFDPSVQHGSRVQELLEQVKREEQRQGTAASSDSSLAAEPEEAGS